MDRIIVTRGIGLTGETMQAWRDGATQHDVELRFMRNSSQDDLKARLTKYVDGYDAVLNLGRLGLDDSHGMVPMFNDTATVSMLHSPGSVRRSPLSGMLPPQPVVDGDGNMRDVWLKEKGFHDRGKTHRDAVNVATLSHLLRDPDSDIQQHVDGQEYRVLSVGDRIVQASTSGGERNYQWVGVKGLPRVLLLAVRYAASLLPSLWTVVGWDFIVTSESEVFLLEGNTCPGVNAATAGRIVQAICQRVEDAALQDSYVHVTVPAWQAPASERLQQAIHAAGLDSRPSMEDDTIITTPIWTTSRGV